MTWFGRTPRKEPPPLDGALAALVKAEQIEVSATDEVRSRVLQRARATPAMRLRVMPNRFWSPARAAVAAAIVFALGVGASAAWRMAERTKPKAPPATTSPADVQSAAPRPVLVDSTDVVKSDRDRERPPRSPAPAHHRPDPLVPAAEIAMLEKARAAITKGAFAAALSPLGEHARQFPAGHLVEEREALRIRALVGLGKGNEARRAAAAFRRRFPQSIMLPRIDELVAHDD